MQFSQSPVGWLVEMTFFMKRGYSIYLLKELKGRGSVPTPKPQGGNPTVTERLDSVYKQKQKTLIHLSVESQKMM